MPVPSLTLAKAAALIQSALEFRAEMETLKARTGKTDEEVFREIANVLDENDRLALEYSLELQAMIASKTPPFTPTQHTP